MTRKLFFSAIILSLAAGCTSANVNVRPVVGGPGQESGDNAASLLEQGKSDFAANRLGKAVGHFRKALNFKPDSIRAMNGLAASYDKLGRFDVAATLYQSALTLVPNSAVTLNNIGYSYYLQKKLDLALLYLKEAAERNEDNNPLISANLNIVSSALQNYAEKPARKTSHKAVSASRDLNLLHSRPKQKKTVRLVRSGSAIYDLYTRPMPKSRQFAVRDRSSKKRVPVNKGSASLTKSSKMQLAAAPKKPAVPNKPAAPKSSDATKSTPANMVVASGAGRRMMAVRMVHYLKLKQNSRLVTSLVSADDGKKNVSTIFYKPGQEGAARALSKSLFSIPRLVKRQDQIATLYLELGADMLNFDRQLIHLFKMQTEEAIHVEL